jgi:hypothetical protein
MLRFSCSKIQLAAIGIAFLLFGFAVLALGAEDPVKPIRDTYEGGDFNQAEFLALKALQHTENLTSSQVLEIQKLLAFCYVALDDTASAISEFLQVLEANPRLTLAPLYISPKIIAVFDEAKRQYRLKPAKKETVTEGSIRLSASLYSLLLPGWGQMRKGQRSRGYVFMATEAVAIGSCIALIVMTENAHDDYTHETQPPKIEDSYDRYRTTFRLRNVAGIVAAAVYTAAFLDCLYGPAPRLHPSLSYRSNPYPMARASLTLDF